MQNHTIVPKVQINALNAKYIISKIPLLTKVIAGD